MNAFDYSSTAAIVIVIIVAVIGIDMLSQAIRGRLL
jgi:ABC-type phosphate/phosphonate transport system permease subunit